MRRPPAIAIAIAIGIALIAVAPASAQARHELRHRSPRAQATTHHRGAHPAARRHRHAVTRRQRRVSRNAPPPAAAKDERHALAAYAAMQHAYYVAGVGMYRGADAWPYSQAMAATISVAALPHMHRRFQPDLIARLSGLQAYADHVDPAPAGYVAQSSPPPSGGTRFNDDNEWIGIELLRLYHLDRQRYLLGAADGLMQMVTAQWVAQPISGVCPGGIPWQSIDVNGDRNTVSNATAAELGAQLYLTTGSRQDLDWALRSYQWVRSCLLDADGLYGDHVNRAGQIDTTEWTYNQGTMIGAGVMLYQATHDRDYLQQAEQTAQAALNRFTPARLATQPEGFNAIYIRNLLLLGGADGNPRYRSFAQWFADDAWYNVRSSRTGLFMADPGGQTRLLDQAAMVQVYALLAEPVSAYF